MKRNCFILVILCALIGQLFAADILVIPEPTQIQQYEETLVIDRPIVTREFFDTECPALTRQTAQMNKDLAIEGSRWNRVRITYLSLESGSPWRARSIKRRYDVEFPVDSESYLLKVTPDEIIIIGADDAGLFYGIQTLKQLVRKKDGFFIIPCVTIYDAPALEFRGVHFFTGHDALEEQKKLIDFMAEHKMNHAVIQVDFLEFEQYPEIRHPNFAQTQEEIRELIEYARERFITVTPLVAALGHAEWAFQNDQNLDIAEDPNNPAAFNVTNPRSYKFIFNIFDEVIDLFEPEYFHIGLDEIDHFGEFPYREETIKYSITEIMDMYMAEVAEYFCRKGIDKIMIWGDMFLAPEEAQDATFAETLRDAKARRAILSNAMRFGKPDEIIVCDWHYAAVEPEMYTSLDIFHQAGVQTVASTWYNPENIRNFTLQAIADKSWGLLQTTWAGYNFFIEENVDCYEQFEAYLLAADYSWSGRTESASVLPYNYSAEFWKRWYAPSLLGGAVVSYEDISAPVLQKILEREISLNIDPNIEQLQRTDEEIPYNVQVKVFNPMDEPVTIWIEADEPLDLTEMLTIPPHSAKQLEAAFAIHRDKLSPRYDIPVIFRIELQGQELSHIVKSLYPSPVWYADSLDQPMPVDGDLSKWEGIDPYVFNEERFTAHKEDWTPEELSVQMYLGQYDADLYLAFEVQDAVHFNEYSTYSIWQGDSVQLGFDFLYSRDRYYSANDLEIGFALGNDDELRHFTWAPHMDITRGLGAVVEYAIHREETTTIYEIRIPLDAHDAEEVARVDKVGFTFAVNDNDGDGFAGGIIGSRGLYDPKNPSQFGTLVLMDR